MITNLLHEPRRGRTPTIERKEQKTLCLLLQTERRSMSIELLQNFLSSSPEMTTLFSWHHLRIQSVSDMITIYGISRCSQNISRANNEELEDAWSKTTQRATETDLSLYHQNKEGKRSFVWVFLATACFQVDPLSGKTNYDFFFLR